MTRILRWLLLGSIALLAVAAALRGIGPEDSRRSSTPLADASSTDSPRPRVWDYPGPNTW